MPTCLRYDKHYTYMDLQLPKNKIMQANYLLFYEQNWVKEGAVLLLEEKIAA